MKAQITAILVGFLILAAPVAAESLETLSTDPGITPDSPLYGLDRAMERVRLMIATDALSKAKVRFEFAQERLAEAQAMSDKNKTKEAEDALVDYETELNETGNEMSKAVALGKNITALTEHVLAMRSKHIAVLQRVYDKVPESAKPAIMNAIEAATNRTTEIASHMERIRNEEQVRNGTDVAAEENASEEQVRNQEQVRNENR